MHRLDDKPALILHFIFFSPNLLCFLILLTCGNSL